jgi:hypothetical protein
MFVCFAIKASVINLIYLKQLVFIIPGFHTLAAVGNSAETGSPGLRVLKLFYFVTNAAAN